MSAAAFFSKCIILRLKRAEAGTTEGSAASVKLSDGKVSLTCGVPVWRGMACSNGVASGRVCVCACVCVCLLLTSTCTWPVSYARRGCGMQPHSRHHCLQLGMCQSSRQVSCLLGTCQSSRQVSCLLGTCLPDRSLVCSWVRVSLPGRSPACWVRVSLPDRSPAC